MRLEVIDINDVPEQLIKLRPEELARQWHYTINRVAPIFDLESAQVDWFEMPEAYQETLVQAATEILRSWPKA